MTTNVEFVLRKFLSLELTKSNISSAARQKIKKCLLLNGDGFLVEVKKIAEEENWGSPVYVYTTGFNNDNRNNHIKKWEMVNIGVTEFYTCGVNEKINTKLKKVKGNVYKFAKSEDRFIDDIPSDENRWAIGIEQKKNNKDGKIELIDGFHRLVSLIVNDYREIQTYVGRK